jgi:lipoprotein-releasing system ATP-binding protein
MSDALILECRNLTKSFAEDGRTVEVIKGIDFALARGELAAIVGSSGSGKTTLLHLLGGLDLPTTGDIYIAGRKLSALSEVARGEMRNRHIGFVYQFHHLLAEFSALENVAMPLLLRSGVSVRQARAESTAMLEQVGLAHRLEHKPAQLSGGERQRVAIARALVTSPDCVLADEPTGNLDVHTAREIQALMLDLNTRLGTTFIVVTHDLSLAGQIHRVFHMEDGRLAEGMPVFE